MLEVRSLTLVVVVMAGCGEGVEDLVSGPSSLHYSYEKSYGYTDHHSPYHGYKHKYGHHQSDIGQFLGSRQVQSETSSSFLVFMQVTLAVITTPLVTTPNITTSFLSFSHSLHPLLRTMDTSLIPTTKSTEGHLDMI